MKQIVLLCYKKKCYNGIAGGSLTSKKHNQEDWCISSLCVARHFFYLLPANDFLQWNCTTVISSLGYMLAWRIEGDIFKVSKTVDRLIAALKTTTPVLRFQQKRNSGSTSLLLFTLDLLQTGPLAEYFLPRLSFESIFYPFSVRWWCSLKSFSVLPNILLYLSWRERERERESKRHRRQKLLAAMRMKREKYTRMKKERNLFDGKWLWGKIISRRLNFDQCNQCCIFGWNGIWKK